jgi:predicted N-formylglutamate amidohydrolase
VSVPVQDNGQNGGQNGGQNRPAVGDAGSDIGGEVVEVINPAGGSAFVLVCEHASNVVPPHFGSLGLDDAALASHIAWDPGARAVALAMSSHLDAALVAARISRLVYDCNRPPEAKSAVAETSEVYEIPGNRGLSETDRRAREALVYRPFRTTLSAAIEQRVARGAAPVLVTVHSFTPVYRGTQRNVDLGILHDTDARFADALLAVAGERGDLRVRRNEPYGPADGVTHTLVDQAAPRGLLNVMLEIRNDLIADAEAQQKMGIWLAECLKKALAAVAECGQDRRHAVR